MVKIGKTKRKLSKKRRHKLNKNRGGNL